LRILKREKSMKPRLGSLKRSIKQTMVFDNIYEKKTQITKIRNESGDITIAFFGLKGL
jgi:hypothetical protein